MIINVYTQFGLNRSIRFQDIEKAPELCRNDRETEKQNDGQSKSSISPTLSKRGL